MGKTHGMGAGRKLKSHHIRQRHSMKVAAARKETGCSWVTMNDGIHVFVSGDKSHPDMDVIYNKLSKLRMEMKARGYTPQIRYALYDLEVENKEELLIYHSERIAGALLLPGNQNCQ